MRKSARLWAAALFAASAVGAGVGGTAWAATDPVTDIPPCSMFSAANACEFAAARAAARDAEWAQAEIHLRDVRNEVHTVDLDPEGPSRGDTIFFDNTLWDPSGMTVVGRFVGQCVQLSDAMHHCEGGLLFPRASLELSTVTTLGGDIVAAVTGGTGEHSGAGGQVLIAPTATAGTSKLAVDLR